MMVLLTFVGFQWKNNKLKVMAVKCDMPVDLNH